MAQGRPRPLSYSTSRRRSANAVSICRMFLSRKKGRGFYAVGRRKGSAVAVGGTGKERERERERAREREDERASVVALETEEKGLAHSAGLANAAAAGGRAHSSAVQPARI